MIYLVTGKSDCAVSLNFCVVVWSPVDSPLTKDLTV